MAQSPAGYSGTPLWKKLGLKEGMAACVIGAPPGYEALIAGGPAMVWGSLRAGVSFIHIFTPFRTELNDTLRASLPLMARDGMIWVSWPKKGSRLPCEYTEDTIREICLPMGLVRCQSLRRIRSVVGPETDDPQGKQVRGRCASGVTQPFCIFGVAKILPRGAHQRSCFAPGDNLPP